MKPESVTVNASKLLADANVTLRVQELSAKAEKKAIATLEDRQELLSKIMENIVYDKDGNATYSDALKAIDLLNKIDGVYIQKNQTEHSGSLGVKFEIVLDNSDD